MFKGCYTALVTPMQEDGNIDYSGVEKLIEFQIANNCQGILAAGTTGESPTLKWEEHNELIERTCKRTKGRSMSIAGTGSNSTHETMEASEHAAHAGADALLLVDPYYNGPSSLEIRREYVEPVAAGFPEVQVIPYIIPGRTGCMMQVEDLAILADQYDNVSSVKEATGDLENMAKTRRVCGEDFDILSGDDDMTVAMMKSSEINAQRDTRSHPKTHRAVVARRPGRGRQAGLRSSAALSDRHGLHDRGELSGSGAVQGAQSPGRKDPHECSRHAIGPVSPASGQDDEGGNTGGHRCRQEGSERRSGCAGTRSRSLRRRHRRQAR